MVGRELERVTLVTTFGVKENPHALELVQSELTLDDLFG